MREVHDVYNVKFVGGPADGLRPGDINVVHVMDCRYQLYRAKKKDGGDGSYIFVAEGTELPYGSIRGSDRMW